MDVEQLIKILPYSISDNGLNYYLIIGKTRKGEILVSYEVYYNNATLDNKVFRGDNLKSALEKTFNYLSAHKPLIFNL